MEHLHELPHGQPHQISALALMEQGIAACGECAAVCTGCAYPCTAMGRIVGRLTRPNPATMRSALHARATACEAPLAKMPG